MMHLRTSDGTEFSLGRQAAGRWRNCENSFSDFVNRTRSKLTVRSESPKRHFAHPQLLHEVPQHAALDLEFSDIAEHHNNSAGGASERLAQAQLPEQIADAEAAVRTKGVILAG
jgi:hypothetical protein